jgi:hypothetical protein
LFTVDGKPGLGSLRSTDVGRVANISEEHAASNFRVDPKGEGITYLQSIVSMANVHTMYRPRAESTFLCFVFSTNVAGQLSGYLKYSDLYYCPQNFLQLPYKEPISLVYFWG